MTTTHPIVDVLLAGGGERWGPLLGAVTVFDVLVVLLVAAAAVRGWHLGITRLVLGIGGLVAGLLGGLWAAVHVIPAASPPGVMLALEIATVVAGAVIGSALGNGLGRRAARLLAAVHLRLPDRLAGAVGRGALTLMVCSVLVAGVGAFAPGQGGSTARALEGGSVVLSLAARATPSPSQVRERVAGDLPIPAALAPWPR